MNALFHSCYGHVTDIPTPVLVALGALILSLSIYNKPNLSHIPTAGSTGLLSYYEGYCSMFRAKKMIQEGYHKFRKVPGFFRVATPNRWDVMIVSPELINELRLARDDELSETHIAEEEIATRFTLRMDVDTTNVYHHDAIRTPMTRNLATKYPEVYDEITQSFEDLIPANDDEWLPVSLSTTLKIVCRASNRLFFWESICRNPEWIDLNIKFTVDVFLRAAYINMFPYLLQPLVGSILSPIDNALVVCRKFFADEVVHRLEMEAEYGKKYEDRPNDLLSWLIGCAPQEEHTVDGILKRILIVNMTAIHTSSNIFWQVMVNLAAHPEYVAPMREEVLRVVREYGWTKAALNEMHKLDSFLRESARFEGIDLTAVRRKVIKKPGYTFANGLYVPYGSWVLVPSFAIHHDEGHYENPFTFDGFRFSQLREDDGEGLKHQMVSTSLDCLHFGLGKHACPGRFFAATELKTMLAHLVTTYEVKLETEPKSFHFGTHFAPDPKQRVLFRRLKRDHQY